MSALGKRFSPTSTALQFVAAFSRKEKMFGKRRKHLRCSRDFIRKAANYEGKLEKPFLERVNVELRSMGFRLGQRVTNGSVEFVISRCDPVFASLT